jgi:hypothetical protein
MTASQRKAGATGQHKQECKRRVRPGDEVVAHKLKMHPSPRPGPPVGSVAFAADGGDECCLLRQGTSAGADQVHQRSVFAARVRRQVRLVLSGRRTLDPHARVPLLRLRPSRRRKGWVRGAELGDGGSSGMIERGPGPSHRANRRHPGLPASVYSSTGPRAAPVLRLHPHP